MSINVTEEELNRLKAQITDLQTRESELTGIMKVAPVGLCHLDADLRYIYINDWLADINGLPAEEHLGRSISELFPDLAEAIEPQFLHVIKTGLPIIKGRAIAETPANPRVKKVFEHSYIPRKSTDGTVIGINCFVEDVSERIQGMEKLEESENELRLILDSVNAVPWRFDLNKNKFTFVGKQVVKLLGYPVSYWSDFDSWASCIHADNRDAAVKYCMDSTAKGLDHDFEYKCLTADGNIVWIRDIVSLRKNDRGIPVELVGYMIDITESKRLENEVSKYHFHLEELITERTTQLQKATRSRQLEHQLLQNVVAAENIEQALRMCLIEISEFLEYDHAEIWIPQEDTNLLKSHYQWCAGSEDSKQFAECGSGLTLEKGQDLAGSIWSAGELEWRSFDSRQIDLGYPRNKLFHRFGIKSMLGVPVKTDRALLAVFCFYSRNTMAPSKQATELISAISLQAALAIDRLHVTSSFEHLIESAPGAMLVTSENGTIKMQNSSCVKLFGYTDSELLGSAIETLIPKSFHRSHRRLRKGIKRHTLPRPMGSGLKIKGRRKDGIEIPIDVSLNLQTTVFGSQFIVGIVDLQDHQKNLDELNASRTRLRDLSNHITRIAERERKSIARDLHDDLGQVLTSLKIDITILESQVSASENTHNSVSISEDLCAMSETLGKASERLHGFVSKLRPEVLDNLGLITALEWQSEEFFKSHRIECKFICELDYLKVPDEIEIAIYRIVQECLTNISRHSKASNCKIKVDQIDSALIIEVSDDGIGVSNEAIASTNRFGLLGVRERASALNGSVQVESTPGEGTTVRIIMPTKL